MTLLAYAGVSVVVAERVTKPYRRALASSPAVFGLQYEDVTFPSTGDAVTLRGWFLPAKGSDRVVVVIVHGRNSNRAGDHGELVPHAEALVERGYKQEAATKPCSRVSSSASASARLRPAGWRRAAGGPTAATRFRPCHHRQVCIPGPQVTRVRPRRTRRPASAPPCAAN